MSIGVRVLTRSLGLPWSRMSRLSTTVTPETAIGEPVDKHLKVTASSTRLPVVSQAEVIRTRQETPTVRCITLKLHNPAFSFKAGQWVDMFIPGMEIVGGFSMFSPPDQLAQDGTIDLGIKFSRWPPAFWVHDQCRIGSMVSMRAGGDFYYAPEAGDDPYDLLLIGGGVGVNPLTSMFLHATSLYLQHQECEEEYKPGRILLLYSARTYQELLYKNQMNATAASTPGVEVQYFTTREPPPHPSLATHGHISLEVLQKAVNSLNTSKLKSFICGPPPMIESINQLLLQSGLTHDQIFYEKWW
ncbi:hypothetical protein Pmani_017880 [Petrolisthes manimaculis]|uniref:Oxidoreductase NAD-binding domain-containing protein 1 n=1 Tax=Petrolisthes manimaculis TaxID=1843537 RepID=A0AAE1P9S9_9EUCA|nr:hypothetical protein Pmani_024186 [Petrolisthes manimaculis]KAK4310556.1 hypothetical protein Pmani_017880 [Petrolisthes manimaculis]